MTDFWTALFFVFIAEMGDKTQLMTLAFSTKYKASTVFMGVCIATILINLIAVALGQGFGKFLPTFWVNLVAGAAFIVFGLLTLRGDKPEEEKKETRHHGPLMTVMIAFFLGEFGDKTMLTAAAVASQHQSFLQVWLGSTIGLIASNSLAIIAGKALGDRFSSKSMKIAIAAVYIISGLLAIGEAFLHH